MARSNGRAPKRAPKDLGRRTRKKVCIFCKEHAEWVDYKDVNLLRKFMSDRGKIRARRVSGNCAQHQRAVAVAIKTAREVALLPYTQRTVSERSGGRGGRGDRGDRGPRPRGDTPRELPVPPESPATNGAGTPEPGGGQSSSGEAASAASTTGENP